MPLSPAQDSNSLPEDPAKNGSTSHPGCLTTWGLMLDELSVAGPSVHTMPTVVDPRSDNALVEKRLGSTAGLFVALRCKRAVAAAHGIRVALLCSAWTRTLEFSTEDRHRVEAACLLHDVGFIGVPDRILDKPSKLEHQETGVMAHARRLGIEMLRAGGAEPHLLEVVANIPVWYNASEKDIPLGARLIAIAEAFDSMITDHVFRPARSNEHAMDELYRCAGTQFDPVLVRQFAQFALRDQALLCREAAGEWMRESDVQTAVADTPLPNMLNDLHQEKEPTGVWRHFQATILDNTREGVILVDPTMTVVGWNRRAEQLTGIIAESIVGQVWRPEVVGMGDTEGRPITDFRCPLRTAISKNHESVEQLSLGRRGGDCITVDAQVLPVAGPDGTLLGATMLLRDLSSERSLEEMCENLHAKATQDALTQVANRAEFERVHEELLQEYRENGTVFSVIICDLDHFKSINDTYGHQAGDEVLVKTAATLRSVSRSTDLVTRYGGEEFVLLCRDCGIGVATRLAEQIRDALSRLDHELLAGRRATGSFGVTQAQSGDTTETILRRADRALYVAKDQGRNRVIQLGSGTMQEEEEREETTSGRWRFWRKRRKSIFSKDLVDEVMTATGPLDVVLEKLRGFVFDHQAEVTSVVESTMKMELDAPNQFARRRTDERAVFVVAIDFSEVPGEKEHDASSTRRGTEVPPIRLHVRIHSTSTARDDGPLLDHARQLISSMRSYLMVRKSSSLEQDNKGKKILLPAWPS